jgi:eukaryotic-like serine/threonine-protein kinase
MPLSPGSRLGPYEVVAPIGAGGMGEVFRARDTRLDRSVAIKILPAEFAQNAQLKLRFEREAKTISQLSHPNICTLYDVGDGYLVMELLDGETVADRIAKGPMAVDQVMKIGAQIADALDRAHQAGVVHRDLKPSNVMLTKSGAKLLDFGLATAGSSAAAQLSVTQTMQKPLTEEGTVIGTYQYMAPEQLAGEEADARTDIFALGTLMYEMATGRRAFDGKTKTSIITAIVSREPTPISQVQPFTPPAFDHVVRKCLTKDPDDRWQSARDIASELRWIIDSGSSAGVAGLVAMRRKSRERVLWIVALIAVAAGSLLIARRMHLGEVHQSYRFTIPMVDAGYKTGGQARVSPDGQTVYFRATSDGRHFQIYRRRLDDLNATPIDGTQDAGAYIPTPDGRSLLLSFPGAVLKRVSVNGGPVETIAEGAQGNGSVSKDGKIILGGDGFPVRLLKPNHTLEAVTALDSAHGETGHIFPWFLPDGKSFLFLTIQRDLDRGTVQHELCGARLGSKEITRIAEVSSRVEYALGHVFFVRNGTLVAQPLDPSTFKLSGEAVPVADNVLFGPRTATAAFSVSANGTIVFQRHPPSSRLVTTDSTGKTLSTVNSNGATFGNRFAILPDASRVIVQVSDTRSGSTSLWVYGLTRETATRLTFSPEIESTPVVTPDGKRVFFSGDAHSTFDIFEAPMDGSEPPKLRVAAPLVQFPTDVSRDGKYLLYWSNQNQIATKQDLWILPLTGDGMPRPFLATPAVENGGAFSPDGKWVAYTSDVTGTTQIYVRPFPGPGEASPVSTRGGDLARFSHDGKRIYWVDGERMMFADFHADGSTSDPILAFELHDQISAYFLMPGSDRFMLMLQNEADASPPARVIVGWQPPANQ